MEGLKPPMKLLNNSTPTALAAERENLEKIGS
jgi:hypothetical protein